MLKNKMGLRQLRGLYSFPFLITGLTALCEERGPGGERRRENERKKTRKHTGIGVTILFFVGLVLFCFALLCFGFVCLFLSFFLSFFLCFFLCLFPLGCHHLEGLVLLGPLSGTILTSGVMGSAIALIRSASAYSAWV